jgi:hypothetical protein
LKIPTSFKLLGKTITVVYDQSLDYRRGWCGSAQYRTDRILIQSSLDSHPRTAADIEQTFCHELVHYIFHEAGYMYSSDKALNDQEGLVEMCGSLLHQALTTMEYEDTPTGGKPGEPTCGLSHG